MHFSSLEEILSACGAEGCRISELARRQTARDMEISEDAVTAMMLERLSVMRQSVEAGLRKGAKSLSGLTGGMAEKMKAVRQPLGGSFLGGILWRSLAVSETNACMGRIVATPTAGSCGILPACLLTLQEVYALTDGDLAAGLLNASAVGMVIAKNATVAGAQGGCQAECGSASAMAASAMVELRGGTPEMCAHAAALALKSLMGLVCDPVAGLVEEPCVIRNPSSAAVAVAAADMALAGIESIIPADEVIAAMKNVGSMLPEALRETSRGGLAVTPTGLRIAEELFSAE